MSSISALHSENKKLIVAGEPYVLSPYTIGMTAKLAKYYEAKGKTINYLHDVFLSGEVTSEFIDVVIETFYQFIIEPTISIEEFSKSVKDKEKDITKLVGALSEIMNDADPVYEIDKKKVPKIQIYLGFAALIFSVIGLIATMLFLVDTAINYKIFSI
jgi:hypothetical protein